MKLQNRLVDWDTLFVSLSLTIFKWSVLLWQNNVKVLVRSKA